MRIHLLIAQQVVTSILLAAFLASASLHALAVAFLLLGIGDAEPVRHGAS